MSPSAPVVTPFPYASLPRFQRAEVASAAILRRRARAHVEPLAAALAELVDVPVRIRVGEVRSAERGRLVDDAIGVLFAPADARDPRWRVLVEVEGVLGASLTARALRQRAPRITDAARSAQPALAGAVAAVLLAALRRTSPEGPVPRVVAAGPAAALARDLALLAPSITTAALTVTLGTDAFEARVSVPDAWLAVARSGSLSEDSLLALGAFPLALSLVLGSTLARPEDLDALAVGDAFVPTGVAATARVDGALVGPMALVAPRSERGWTADLAGDGHLVVRGRVASHPWEHAMPSGPSEESSDLSGTHGASSITTVELLESAPVVVRVELGTVSMTAREWAALGTDDVLTLGRKLGDPAILRVAGVEVARGELVSVEGELAVRITSRTTSDRGEHR